jgi:quinol monooxygenase YgiN
MVTVIDVFRVPVENQQHLVGLIERTNEMVRRLPGFISASLHRSLDGMNVVNYIQWESHETFEAMLANPVTQRAISEALQMASAEPKVYEVVRVIERG